MKKTYKNADQIRKEITQKMIDSLKQNVIPWRMHWVCSPNAGMPCNFRTSRRYTGINPILLYLSSYVFNFQSKHWGTAASWTKTFGVHIKKGQKASYITLFKQFFKKNQETGVIETTKAGKPVTIPLLREYAVFNVEQVQAPDPTTLLGVPKPFTLLYNLLGSEDTKRNTVITKEELLVIAKKYIGAISNKNLSREEIAKTISEGIAKKIEKYLVIDPKINNDPDFTPAEELIKKSKAKIVTGQKAAYNMASDIITMPKKTQFVNISHYYQTMFHEMSHWVFDGNRIDAKQEHNRAFSELVAEISSCFVLSALEVPLADEVIEKSQSYVKEWVGAMDNDPKYIFNAASIASRVSEYLLAMVGKENPAFQDEEE